MSNRPKSITSVFSNRTGTKKRPGQHYAPVYRNTNQQTAIPRLNVTKDQMQRSTYIPNRTQVDIHHDYNTYQNVQDDQNIPNNYHIQPTNGENLQQYNNTIPRPTTLSTQMYQYPKLATITQHEPLISPVMAHHPEIDMLRKENEQLKVVITKRDEKIHDLESEMKIVKDQNVQFQKIYKHLQNFDDNQSSKGRFQISKLFLQMKLMKRPSKDELKKKKILQSNELVFDNELDRIPQHEFIKLIPKIVVECVMALQSNQSFMKMNGLYRVSGNYAQVQKLRYDIDNNKYSKIHDQKDPHNIANVLKLFLRELKTPLISHAQLQAGIPSLNSFDNDLIEAKICKIQKLYHSLPEVNRETLKYLIGHLEKVADTRDNNMTSEHLAIIFGACIFNDITNTLNSKDDMDLFLNSTAIPNLCIRLMIENYEEIFEKKYLGMDDENADDDNNDCTDNEDDGTTYKNYEVDHYDEKYGTLV